jgi:flagellar basal body P-ring protein FlgI
MRMRPASLIAVVVLVCGCMRPSAATPQAPAGASPIIAGPRVATRPTMIVTGLAVVARLNGTGDGPDFNEMLRVILGAMRAHRPDLPVEPDRSDALVCLTAEVPRSPALGAPVEVQVSSLGDATGIVGGTLVWGRLQGFVPGEVMVTAEGPVVPGPYAGTLTWGRVSGVVTALPEQ